MFSQVGREEATLEPFNACNFRPSEASGQFGCPSGITDLISNDVSHSCGLNSNRICLPRQWLSYHHSVLSWPTSSTNYTIQSKEAPDLELKLAVPMPLELTKLTMLQNS